MSKSVKTITFGHIGEDPVILTEDEGFILRGRNKRWSRLRDQEYPKLVKIKHRSFIRRFGVIAERLPISLSQSISQLRVDGKLVALSRTAQSDCFLEAGGTLRLATVFSLQDYRDRIERENGIFNLGSHTYSGGPGSSWSCDYRIERLNDDGTLWDILATDEETAEYQSWGSHSLEAAQGYFDSVGFHISQDQWEAMGATFPVEEDDCEEFEEEMDDESVAVE